MGFYPEIWAGSTFEELRKRQLENTIRIYQSVTDYTPLVKNAKASAYNGAKIAKVTAEDLPYAGAFTDPTKTNIYIPFSEKKGVPQLLNDIDDAQTDLNLLQIYSANAVDSLLDAYDGSVVNTVIDGTAVANRSQMSGGGATLTLQDFKDARTALNVAEAPNKGRYCVVDPTLESQIWDIPEFISRDKIGRTDLADGVIGTLLGFQVIMSTFVPQVDGVTGAVVAGVGKRVAVFYQSLSTGFARALEFTAKSQPQASTPGDLLMIYSNYGVATQEDTYSVTIREN